MNDNQMDDILDILNRHVLRAKNEVLDIVFAVYPELDQEEVAEVIQDHMNEIEF